MRQGGRTPPSAGVKERVARNPMASQREEPPMDSVNVGERMRQLRRGLVLRFRISVLVLGLDLMLKWEAR